MSRLFFLFLLIIVISLPLLSQQNIGILESINKKFQSFNYQAVIEHADSLLTAKQAINDSDNVEIYRLKGVSHYSLLQMRLALNSFINILKLNPDYELNQIQNSPKIVKYFNEIKETFSKNMINAQKKEDEFSSALIKQRDTINKSIGYSLLLPGLGHLQKDESTKGWSLISAACLTLGSSIYFTIDANQKENKYLNESDKTQIGIKYERYNESYKYRNISLISFAIVWLYSQLDLLILNTNNSNQISVNPKLNHKNNLYLNINIQF